VDLDPHAIERSDFATTRRGGYDPTQVDAHLREVAAAVEDLQAELDERAERETLAGEASERVRAILDAAEASAAEVRSEAEENARRLVDEARAEADELTRAAERRRREAEADAETVGSERRREVERRADELIRRAEELDAQLEGLLAPVRSAVADVVAELRGEVERVRAGAVELPARAGPGNDVLAPPADEEPAPATEPLTDRPATEEPVVGGEEEDPLPEEEPVPKDEAQASTGPPMAEGGSDRESKRGGGDEAGGHDTEGARLIALNMALSGSSREETAEYLRETFGLDDAALLDDVYRRVEAT